MKRTAFIQALVIFLLLIGSWILLVLRLSPEAVPEEASEPAKKASSLAEPTPTPESSRAVPDDPSPDVPAALEDAPEGWQEWLAYLKATRSPEQMRAALAELRSSIFAMPADEAVARLREMLRSGVDLQTGLAFQVSSDGPLEGASSLRALLLDWLATLDPSLAAGWAESELEAWGTGLSPDEYTVHLRNYTLGTGATAEARSVFLDEHLGKLLAHEPWLENPTAAVVQAFDVAVYTEATRFIKEFQNLMAGTRPSLVRQASAVAVERLVDRAPVAALRELLQGTTALHKARAGFFARLDPAYPDASQVFNAYLSSPKVSSDEIEFFIRSFPNLNKTYSYSLMGTQNSITESDDSAEHVENALQQIRQWQAAPAMEAYDEVLEAQESFLDQQLRQIPES